MIESLRSLVTLHEIDVALERANSEREALPGRRVEAQATRARAHEVVESIQQTLAQAETDQRRLEGELKDRESLVVRLESQTYEVKTSEAYAALQHEMTRARETISEHETGILELLEVIDEQKASLVKARKSSKQIDAEVTDQEAQMSARSVELAEECERLKTQRAECCKGVDAGMLSHYERVAIGRRPVISIISAEFCPMCQMAIPRQTTIEIQAGRSLPVCGGCQRLLIGESVIADRPAPQ